MNLCWSWTVGLQRLVLGLVDQSAETYFTVHGYEVVELNQDKMGLEV
jgi:hypothetical protein